MLKRAMRIAALGALLCQLQVPAVLLQTTAWAGMAWRYSRSHTVADAVHMTFDGRHPCGLCVRLGLRGDRAREIASRDDGTRPAFVLIPVLPALRPPSSASFYLSGDFLVSDSVPLPDTPPPKSPPV
jgi:hypothetical protein